MNRRALWLAIEWGLPPCPRIGRTLTKELSEYIRAHEVSFDWLIHGDLKGLQMMMQARRTNAPTAERLKQKLALLSEPEREIVRRKVEELMEGRT
jgi:hypothetical protein